LRSQSRSEDEGVRLDGSSALMSKGTFPSTRMTVSIASAAPDASRHRMPVTLAADFFASSNAGATDRDGAGLCAG